MSMDWMEASAFESWDERHYEKNGESFILGHCNELYNDWWMSKYGEVSLFDFEDRFTEHMIEGFFTEHTLLAVEFNKWRTEQWHQHAYR